MASARAGITFQKSGFELVFCWLLEIAIACTLFL
jgi:hypothetical protein